MKDILERQEKSLKELLELQFKYYKKEQEIYRYMEIEHEYYRLVDVWVENGGKYERDRMDPYSTKACGYSGKGGNAVGSFELLKLLVRTLKDLGEICVSQKRYEEAEAYYVDMLIFSKRAKRAAEDIERERELAEAYMQLGKDFEDFGLSEDARYYYAESERYFERYQRQKEPVNESSIKADSVEMLANCYADLGNLCKVQEKFEEAEDYYMKSECYYKEAEAYIVKLLDLTESDPEEKRRLLIERINENSASRDDASMKEWDVHQNQENTEEDPVETLFYGYGELAHECEVQGEYQEADKYYIKSLECAQQLYEKTKSIENLDRLARRCLMLGNLSERRDFSKKAEQYYIMSLEYRERICEDVESSKAEKHYLMDMYLQIGDFHNRHRRYEEAEAYYVMLEKCGEKYQDWHFVFLAYARLKRINEKQSHFAEAKEYHKKARAAYLKDNRILPGVRILWSCFLVIGFVMLILGVKKGHLPMTIVGACISAIVLILWALVTGYTLKEFHVDVDFYGY